MNITDAILLGLVQGFTEFLPISSSGHLVFARSWFGIETEFGLAFDAVLHLATALAVVAYFFPEIKMLVHTLLRKLGRLPVNTRDESLLYALIVGTIPAATLGIVFESKIEADFNSAFLVASVMFVSALFFIVAEWYYSRQQGTSEVTLKKGLMIGLFQAMALIPGFSRSGATIAGGMILGLTRHEAARFSFLLAIPVTLGAGAKNLLDFAVSGESASWAPLFVGSAVAGATAFMVIHYFLAFLRRFTLWPFIWYKLILSVLVIGIIWLN